MLILFFKFVPSTHFTNLRFNELRFIEVEHRNDWYAKFWSISIALETICTSFLLFLLFLFSSFSNYFFFLARLGISLEYPHWFIFSDISMTISNVQLCSSNTQQNAIVTIAIANIDSGNVCEEKYFWRALRIRWPFHCWILWRFICHPCREKILNRRWNNDLIIWRWEDKQSRIIRTFIDCGTLCLKCMI